MSGGCPGRRGRVDLGPWTGPRPPRSNSWQRTPQVHEHHLKYQVRGSGTVLDAGYGRKRGLDPVQGPRLPATRLVSRALVGNAGKQLLHQRDVRRARAVLAVSAGPHLVFSRPPPQSGGADPLPPALPRGYATPLFGSPGLRRGRRRPGWRSAPAAKPPKLIRPQPHRAPRAAPCRSPGMRSFER